MDWLWGDCFTWCFNREGAVIGAGSVVCNDIPNDCVAVGNPCSVVRKLKREYEKLYCFKKDTCLAIDLNEYQVSDVIYSLLVQKFYCNEH